FFNQTVLDFRTMDVINVRNLSKDFNGRSVHHDVSFEVHEGECLGLLGGSGAGKSVILRSIIGLERPDGGEIRVDGDEIHKLTESQLIEVRKKVAYVFQYGALFDSMSVYENIAYPLREHTKMSECEVKQTVHGLLKDFNLEGIEDRLPAELSGGMQKRVGLARAIVLQPKVILYDEPTAGLDPANTVTIQNLILQLKKRKVTSILVTHDMDTALAVCDRLLLLKGGSAVELGAVEELKRNRDELLNI